jgi:hypothetical protein
MPAGTFGQAVPRERLPWLLACVGTLVGIFGWGEFHPDSLIGQLMRLPGGTWAIRWIALGALLLVLYVWYKVSQWRSASKTDNRCSGK